MLVAAQAALESGTPAAQFAPVVDGVAIPHDPFSPTAPPESKNVPMIISTTRDEGTAFAPNADTTEAGLLTAVQALAGPSNAAMVIAAYRGVYPDASPSLLLAKMTTDSGIIPAARTQAERKVAQGGGAAYMYLFTWPSPADPARWGAPHGIDVALAFHNPVGPITGDGPRAQQLATDLAGAWVRFAHTGNPNGGSLPQWPTYETTQRQTLVLGDQTTVESDPLQEFRLLWANLVR